MEPIVVHDLSYQYEESERPAVSGIHFTVEPGQIVGLLGHNGSGKTTIMNCIVGLLQPTTGKVMLSGMDVNDRWEHLHVPVGFVPAHPTLYNMLTVEEFVMFIGKLHKMSADDVKKISEPLFELLYLTSKRKELIHTLSGGMKQKVAMIAGLLHHPAALVLDEPMTGYDAKSTKQMKEFLLDLASQRETGILLSSHRLDIVESICQKLVVIREGELVFTGSVSELKEKSESSLEEAFLSMTSVTEE